MTLTLLPAHHDAAAPDMRAPADRKSVPVAWPRDRGPKPITRSSRAARLRSEVLHSIWDAYALEKQMLCLLHKTVRDVVGPHPGFRALVAGAAGRCQVQAQALEDLIENFADEPVMVAPEGAGLFGLGHSLEAATHGDALKALAAFSAMARRKAGAYMIVAHALRIHARGDDADRIQAWRSAEQGFIEETADLTRILTAQHHAAEQAHLRAAE